jgi:hypothetical protein
MRDGLLVVVAAVMALAGCGTSDPCTELCDGIARCREGNASCAATEREAFMTTCVSHCEASAEGLSEAEAADARECLECLRAETGFSMCVGETLLDTTCASTCRNPGTIVFRNEFGPAAFSDLSLDCLREP